MKKNYISLILDSPLQSWGASSHPGIDFRTTLRHPTKSGIIGIISAAMGIDRSSPEEPKLIKSLSQQISVKFFELSKPFIYPQRQVVVQKITDFAAIGNYMLAEGKKKAIGKYVISKKQYLCDITFIAILEIENEELSKKIESSLKNPKWGIWLGRKCCIPSLPLFVQRSTKWENVWKAVWQKFQLLDMEYPKPSDFLSIEPLNKEDPDFQKGELIDNIMDEPRSFSRPNQYVSRRILKRHPQE